MVLYTVFSLSAIVRTRWSACSEIPFLPCVLTGHKPLQRSGGSLGSFNYDLINLRPTSVVSRAQPLVLVCLVMFSVVACRMEGGGRKLMDDHHSSHPSQDHHHSPSPQTQTTHTPALKAAVPVPATVVQQHVAPLLSLPTASAPLMSFAPQARSSSVTSFPAELLAISNRQLSQTAQQPASTAMNLSPFITAAGAGFAPYTQPQVTAQSSGGLAIDDMTGVDRSNVHNSHVSAVLVMMINTMVRGGGCC